MIIIFCYPGKKEERKFASNKSVRYSDCYEENRQREAKNPQADSFIMDCFPLDWFRSHFKKSKTLDFQSINVSLDLFSHQYWNKESRFYQIVVGSSKILFHKLAEKKNHNLRAHLLTHTQTHR